MSEAKAPKLQIAEEDRWRTHASYAQIYARDWRDLCAFLGARFGMGPPDPEDIAQQAFFKLGELEPTRRPDSPRAFVFRIAINLMLDARRSLTRKAHLLAVTGPLLSLEGDHDPGQERGLIAKQELRLLDQVVAGLPERHRAYLLAHRIEGLTAVSIAQRHGVSPSLVRKTIDEALAVCQQALADGTIDHRRLSRERSR